MSTVYTQHKAAVYKYKDRRKDVLSGSQCPFVCTWTYIDFSGIVTEGTVSCVEWIIDFSVIAKKVSLTSCSLSLQESQGSSASLSSTKVSGSAEESDETVTEGEENDGNKNTPSGKYHECLNHSIDL